MKEAAEKKQVYNPYLPTYEYVPDLSLIHI